MHIHRYTNIHEGGEERREREKGRDRDRETEGDEIREHIIFSGKIRF